MHNAQCIVHKNSWKGPLVTKNRSFNNIFLFALLNAPGSLFSGHTHLLVHQYEALAECPMVLLLSDPSS